MALTPPRAGDELDDGARALGGPAAAAFAVTDGSQVGEVRRAAESLALAAGLGDTERGALAIIVTEAATNLARHAVAGRILLSTVGDAPASGVEVLAVDEGPGIPNLARAMEDGWSTAGTPGNGLGAIRRMAGDFDLFSQTSAPGTHREGAGTILVARVWSAAAQRAHEAAGARRPRIGAVCVALGGGRVSGDAWAVLALRDRTVAVVVDGLGHGPEAAVASSAAIRVVREAPDLPPGELVNLAHGALRATRGAAMAVAVVRPQARSLSFAGVGNISAGVYTAGGGSRSLASHNGTVGHVMRRVQEFEYEWPLGGLLLMHSDGVHTRWRLDAYPGILRHDPALVAAALYRDASRGRDDLTVVALGERHE